MTWTTWDAGNPVILDPPSPYADQWKDFRDPSVFWHEPTKKWIAVLSLAQLHKLLIYTSSNLKEWTLVSEFGPVNAAGGVWECPSIFPLPLDGNEADPKWVAQIGLNPGGPPGTTGSGTQYIVGSFNGTSFTADSNNIYAPPSMPSDSVVFQDFESSGTYAALGWNTTGGFIGAGPANGSLGGQQTVTGYNGNRYVNSFLDGDSTTGTLTSPSFQISQKYINFLIGGGNNPNLTAINLKIGGEIVRTATGKNNEKLEWYGWDVSDFKGQSAVVEIVDTLTGGWGHINIDAISFSNTLAVQQANWMDWGPDFYAAIPFNGLPVTNRTNLGWMSNWQYGAVIPTDPWRSAMSIPRKLSLETINNKTTLLQQPTGDLSSLETSPKYSRSWAVKQEGYENLNITGKALDITLTFSTRSPVAGKLPQIGLTLRATSDLAQQTRVGYDFTTQQVFVDRTKSGDVSFDATFASVYYAPLSPGSDGTITLRILVDWSSVEVFGGVGEAAITAQIFPDDQAINTGLFSTGCSTQNVTVNASKVNSSWN